MGPLHQYGKPPWNIVLLHGGPGAPGEMASVARELDDGFGILEPYQTANSVSGQVEELHQQIHAQAKLPVVLVGFSWGAWLGIFYTHTYPLDVEKLILIGSGPITQEYVEDLMPVRLAKLPADQRKEVDHLIHTMTSGKPDKQDFSRFGQLISRADAFELLPDASESNIPDIENYQAVWPEASKLRRSGELLQMAAEIACPVVAIHGLQDPHPILGVQVPLSKNLKDFRMIPLDRCGHKPWQERYARDAFFRILEHELRS